MGTQCPPHRRARYLCVNSRRNPDDLTVPILDRAQLDALRRSTEKVRGPDPVAAPPPATAWLLMMLLGLGIVVAMLVLVVAWS